MLAFCLAYFTLSLIVLGLYAVFSEVDLDTIKPALGRRILLILLLPAVFVIGISMEVSMAVQGENSWAAFKESFGRFLNETQEVWRGR